MTARKLLSRAALGLVFGASCLGAGHVAAAPNRQDEIRELRMQIEALRQQNEALMRRLDQMERGAAEQSARIKAQEARIDEQAGAASRFGEALDKIGDRVAIHGRVDGDLLFRGDYGGADTSELSINKVEMELHGKLTDWARALTRFKWEGGSTYVEEADLTFGGTADYPLFLKVGKMDIPSIEFQTFLVQDPFTKTLAETNEPSAVLGWTGSGLTASVFAYNGVDELGDDKTINGAGAAIRYDYASEDKNGLAFNFGAAIVNNYASYDIADSLTRAEGGGPQLTETPGGLYLHAFAGYAGFSAIAKYTTALDEFNAADLAFKGGGARPAALDLELAYGAEIVGRRTVFALSFQKTWEALAMQSVVDMPERRWSAVVSVGLLDGLTLALEGFLDEDYATADGGTGDEGYGFTSRLIYTF